MRKPGKRDAEVLDAAIRVFYRRGYADATVQDVADEVGILKGSLYHYISTKEDLLYRLFEQVHEDVQKILEEAREAPDLDPVERLELYVRRQVAYNVENFERITVYYHDAGLLAPDHLKVVRWRRREHNRFISDLIVQAQQDSLVDSSLDPRLLANCVFSTIIWTYRWFRPERMDAEQVAEVCQEFAVHGVRAQVGLGADGSR